MSTHLGKYPGIFKRGCEFYIYIIETFGVLFLFFTFFLGWGGGGGVGGLCHVHSTGTDPGIKENRRWWWGRGGGALL